MKKQVNGLFEIVDGLTDDLMSHDRQVMCTIVSVWLLRCEVNLFVL